MSELEEVERAPDSPAWRVIKLVLGVPTLITGVVAGGLTYSYSGGEIEKMVEEGSQNGSMPSIVVAALEQYLDLRNRVEDQINFYAKPTSDKLLPDLESPEAYRHYRTLVLDLDETLVYSEWTRGKGWRTYKRPGVDEFLRHMSQMYEIVVYSKENQFYVDPILERLDPNHYITHRLYRHDTLWQDGEHRKDLGALNRDIRRVLYISAQPGSYSLQPDNAIPVKAYKGDPGDTALLELVPFLDSIYKFQPPDVRVVMASYAGMDIPSTFRERQSKLQARLGQPKKSSLFGAAR